MAQPVRAGHDASSCAARRQLLDERPLGRYQCAGRRQTRRRGHRRTGRPAIRYAADHPAPLLGTRPNLAITSLVPESGVRAAGVEMWMSVSVANYGDSTARGVTVQLEQDGDALPSLVLDDIPARDEITHKFRVQFAGIGGHSLTASLGADAVDIDNRRYFACDLPAARPVVIVDGSKDGR